MYSLGSFYLSRELINNNLSMCHVILSNVVVIRAEMMYESDAIFYTGFSHGFIELELGQKAPLYLPIYDLETRQFIKWDKV